METAGNPGLIVYVDSSAMALAGYPAGFPTEGSLRERRYGTTDDVGRVGSGLSDGGR